MQMLVDFLDTCVKRQKDGKINPINTHKNMEMLCDNLKKHNINITSAAYQEILYGLVKANDAILNKKDETAMEYSEKNYNTAKTLTLTNQTKRYNLTDEDNITKLNSAAFITTAIILEATLVLTLIISLFVLVK